LDRALERTASLWPEVRQGAQWLRQATAILDNSDGASAQAVQLRYEQWLRELERAEPAQASVQHFLKVTRSYGADLFHCYDLDGLPRTNNALEQTFGSVRSLEQTFGSVRYHERRASGRIVASPSLVTDGSMRVPAALYTRAAPVTVHMLASVPHQRWRERRAEMERQHEARRQRSRFRRDPQTYLAELENTADKLTLRS
jgi:hypothetical protein